MPTAVIIIIIIITVIICSSLVKETWFYIPFAVNVLQLHFLFQAIEFL